MHGQSSGGRMRCSGFRDVPLVKSATADEWEPTARAVCSRREFHCAGSGEAAVDSGGSPQLSDR
eukprot:928390-Pleurochrysis_carterae.AAC.1